MGRAQDVPLLRKVLDQLRALVHLVACHRRAAQRQYRVRRRCAVKVEPLVVLARALAQLLVLRGRLAERDGMPAARRELTHHFVGPWLRFGFLEERLTGTSKRKEDIWEGALLDFGDLKSRV